MVTGPLGAGILGVGQFPDAAATVPPWQSVDGDQYLWGGVDPFNPKAEWKFTDHVGALDSFVGLTAPSDVLRFARRFGSLIICAHGIPKDQLKRNRYACQECGLNTRARCKPRHCVIDETAKATGAKPWVRCRTRSDCWLVLTFWEPIDGWLWLSKIAKSVVTVSAAVHGRRRPDDDSFEFLWEQFHRQAYGQVDKRYREMPDWSADDARVLVNYVIFWWLIAGDVTPLFTWDEKGTKVEFGGGLFGALGLQLMRAVSRAHSLSVCSGCGQTYERMNRRPKAGQRNYCPECREKVSNRLRQRNWREKENNKNGKARKR